MQSAEDWAKEYNETHHLGPCDNYKGEGAAGATNCLAERFRQAQADALHMAGLLIAPVRCPTHQGRRCCVDLIRILQDYAMEVERGNK